MALKAIWVDKANLQRALNTYGSKIKFIAIDRENPWNEAGGCKVLLVIDEES